ncbi:chromatin accessibility complex protein 1 [Trichogramma pretiosum]|uniref:chromatin accessibility complex protein 1 n=1 Tax=Trichogramma pretiosum TaxID=7493 RepID=UPI0006C97E26|nr:chromatin accessibility complex protein 1 [Trichogramma pretiosum]XP_014237081.1 chromatin accessibility complex protein 1 [Trichogramma pretiosum]
MASPSKALKDLRLPVSRVKTIMKSSPQVEAIGQDCLFLVAKATELFIHFLSEEAYKKSNKAACLDYKHLAEVVHTEEVLEFLREIMPRKITVRQFKQMMADKNPETSSDSDSDSQSDSESNSDSDEKMENGNSSDSNDSNKKNGNDSSEESSESEEEKKT